MKLWISAVVAAIALAGPTWAGEGVVGGEARQAWNARLEQGHASRIALAEAVAEHPAAAWHELLRATATRVAPPLEAPHSPRRCDYLRDPTCRRARWSLISEGLRRGDQSVRCRVQRGSSSGPPENDSDV